jgi:hypothetical protein
MTSRQRNSPENRQEQVGRAQFVDFLGPFEWIAEDIVHDLGEDILVRIYDQGVSTGLSLDIQHKSVQHIEDHQLKSGAISYRFEVADLEHWQNQDPPVFIVVWDTNRREGWWIGADEAILDLDKNKPSWRGQKKVQVHIPVENGIDENGLRTIRRILAYRIFPLVAKDKEFGIPVRFEFPSTPEGRAQFEEFKRHIETGDEAQIEGIYIKKFELPDWWRRLYGEIELDKMAISMGPLQSPETQPTQIDFISIEHGQERIPYVELRNVQAGDVEATLTNDHQNIPFRFRIVINKNTGRINFNLTIKYSNVDAYTARQGVRIQQILASGGTARLTMLNTGGSDTLSNPEGRIPPPPEELIEYVENLCVIQDKTGKILRFPADGSIALSDFIIARELISILRTGVYHPKSHAMEFELRKHAIDLISQGLKRDEPLRFRLLAEESPVKLLSEQIDLGPVTRYISGRWEMPLEAIRSWLGKASDDDTLKVELVDVVRRDEFTKWLPNN